MARTDVTEREATAPEVSAGAEESAHRHSLLTRLYTGTGAFEIIGQRRRWFGVSLAIVLICLASVGIRGFTLGIDFVGGTVIQFPTSSSVTTEQVEDAFERSRGEAAESVQIVGSGDSQTVQIRTSHITDRAESDRLQKDLFDAFQPVGRDGRAIPAAISISDVSDTWGQEITRKALIALAVFLAIVLVYIAIRFDKEMSAAALVTLFFDLFVTAGVYSIVGFEVTPATIIGGLTILGFSLYDTVVVFDKVEENTRGVLHTTRRTYAEQANLGVNQTLMRSINTTVISVLPIIALMVIAVWLLGVGTLKDLGLVQLVGVVIGTYSSVFLATPLLVVLKQRQRKIKAHTAKVLARRAAAETGR